MNPLTIEHEELLTGYIDGQLSALEVRKVEELLASSSEAKALLETLKLNRQAVASMPHFVAKPISKSIVALAKERCADNNLSAPWVINANPPSIASTSRTWWTSPGSLLLIAAAVSCLLVGGAVYLSLIGSDSTNSNLIATNDPASPIPNDQTQIPLEREVVTEPRQAIAQGTASAQKEVSDQSLPNSNGLSTLSTDQIVSNTPNGAELKIADEPMTPGQQLVPESDPNIPNSLAGVSQTLEGFPEDLAVEMGELLVIIDVVGNQELESLEILEDILVRHDIASGREINVDEEVIQGLEKSRLVESIASEERRSVPTESTSFVFVKARATRLDAAIMEVMRDVEAFPQFSFDLAMDAPSMELFEDLRHVQEVELSRVKQPTAREASIASVLTHDRLRGRFARSNRSQYMSAENRRSADVGI